MIEVLANIFNIKTEAVRKTTHHIISGIDEMDRLETQEKGRFVQCAFSHGTYIVKRAIEDLPDKYAARVHVITCGGTSIPSDRVASSISYACLGDPVPFLLDPLNMAKKLSSGKTNIIFAKPDSLADAFKAHRWDNNAYQRAVVNRYRSLN